MKEILCAGFGGQGVLTSALILAEVALANGKTATWSPSYGSAMRGGSACCTVKYSSESVCNPMTEEPDILLAMNAESVTMYYSMIKPGGIMIINSDLVSKEGCNRSDVTLYEVPCTTLAHQIGQPRGANVIMTAAIIKLSGDFTYEGGLGGMNDMFRKKGKEKFETGNTAAFKAGYEAV